MQAEEIRNTQALLLGNKTLAEKISQDRYFDHLLVCVLLEVAGQMAEQTQILKQPLEVNEGTKQFPAWLRMPFSTEGSENWADTIGRALNSAEGSYIRGRLMECMTVEKIADLVRCVYVDGGAR